ASTPMDITKFPQRKCVGKTIVTNHAGDFLNEIDGPSDILTSRGHLYDHLFGTGHGKAEAFEGGSRLLVGILYAHDAPQIFCAQRDALRRPLPIYEIDDPLCASRVATVR